MTAPVPAETPVTAPKRMNPKHLRQTLYWLALDWIHLSTELPTPSRPGESTRIHASRREYGHPAEWASDKATEVVDLLTSWHDYLTTRDSHADQADRESFAHPHEPVTVPNEREARDEIRSRHAGRHRCRSRGRRRARLGHPVLRRPDQLLTI